MDILSISSYVYQCQRDYSSAKFKRRNVPKTENHLRSNANRCPKEDLGNVDYAKQDTEKLKYLFRKKLFHKYPCHFTSVWSNISIQTIDNGFTIKSENNRKCIAMTGT